MGVKDRFYEGIKDLQEKITAKMQEIDPDLKLTEDIWQREDDAGQDGGGGRTRAFTGSVFENAGVNISKVYGQMKPEFAQRIGASGDQLFATGISLIIHPKNPRVPTVHANFRLIQGGDKMWFGGGADLTPYYPHEEDFHYFHQVWKDACAPYGTYPEWKKACDEYFVNTHRDGEMRGIGGIFYDHFFSGDGEKDTSMSLDIASSFIKSFFPLVEKRMNEEFDSEDEDFMLHRRGRYVEFNLLHDRGTHFGLQSKGRVDSILISLPARCRFTYAYRPKEGSPHEKMMDYFHPKQW